MIEFYRKSSPDPGDQTVAFFVKSHTNLPIPQMVPIPTWWINRPSPETAMVCVDALWLIRLVLSLNGPYMCLDCEATSTVGMQIHRNTKVFERADFEAPCSPASSCTKSPSCQWSNASDTPSSLHISISRRPGGSLSYDLQDGGHRCRCAVGASESTSSVKWTLCLGSLAISYYGREKTIVYDVLSCRRDVDGDCKSAVGPASTVYQYTQNP